MIQRPTKTHTTARTLLLALAVTSLAAGGCSRNDEAKAAVSEAGLEFQKISVGDATLSESVASTAYTKAGDLASNHAGGEGPYDEAASVSLALSKLGLSGIAGGEASDAETKAMHKSRVIRAHLSEWISMNAVAKASTNFDVSDDRAALRELVELREVDVESYTELYNSYTKQIEELQSNIADLEARSMQERNEGARFELQMTGVSATEAAELASRVREHSLRADSYELEAERIRGRVGQLLPGAHEVELQVKKAKDQIDLLNLSLDELDQRVRDSKEDSAQARANAQQAQSALTELVDELEEFRQNTVEPASERVFTLIRQSLSASRDARSTAKTSGAIAKATAQEHLGRATMRLARGEAEMVSLYQSILASGLPGDWQPKVDQHSARYEELVEQGQQAFQDAASALRSVRARGEVGESVEAAAVRLDRLGGVEPEPEYEEEYDDSDDFDSEDEYESDEVDG
ncbi:MAG: hypothetical protein JJ974_12580 [Phycisphaerales bacterium]|nr:hypothetical protein [Phycisphaerales bacterium]